MKVAIYTRVSTLRQQQSQTIEQQLERLQLLGAIRSSETGFDRGMGGKVRTVFFDNWVSM